MSARIGLRSMQWVVAVALGLGVAATATVSGGSADAAGDTTTVKRRVAIEVVFNGEAELFGTFALTVPRSTWGDIGKVTGPPSQQITRGTRNGQDWERYRIALSLRGKKGTLDVRSTTTFVSAGNRYKVFTGTWTVTGGTGSYQGARGGGPATGVLDLLAPENTQFQFLYEGFLATR